MDDSSSNTGIQSSSFSAVLQEIFQQAQTEIQARDRNVSSHFGSHLALDFPSVLDDTFRYEPLMDPALSYITEILAQDDLEDSLPCRSLNEFVALQEKTTEVAALLKEDSPSLTLKVESENPLSPDGISTSMSEDSYLLNLQDPAYTELFSHPDPDSPSFSNSFSEPSINGLLLHSLRGSVGSQANNLMKAHAQEVSFPESFDNGQLISTDSVEGPDASLGKPHVHRSQKSPKPRKVLKPRKVGSITRKKSGKGRSSKDADQGFVDINDLLLQSAQAVGVDNTKRAMEILHKVKQHASPYGNGAQRLAYYFAEAMDARFSGTGWPLYWGLLRRRPTSAEILKASCMYIENCPFVKASHFFINQTILNVSKGASKVHILELQTSGFQYPSLFKAFADRPGGPPQVHLIGIGFPHYSILPARTDLVLEGIEKLGRQLKDCAASYGVPFEYSPWAGKREDLQMQDFVSPERSSDEVLVVISASLLRYVMDEVLDSPIVRSKLLKQGRDINPDVYIQGIVTGSYSTPFFTRRFREALFHFESLFDMLDTFIGGENSERVVFESEILGKAILNIVACEGTKLVDRVDKYKDWLAYSEDVGFKQLPLDLEIKDKVHVMLKSWHKEYTVAEDCQYLLMGWKGRMLHAMSTWRASA